MRITTILLLILVINLESLAQLKHLGIWNGIDGEGNTVNLILTEDSSFIPFKIVGNDTLQSQNGKYVIDYSKNPIWFDISFYISNKVTTVKSIIQFDSDSTIFWQKSTNPNVRPNKISINDKENCIVLHKSKGKYLTGKSFSYENNYVVLDSSLANEVLSQCSRGTPSIDGSWNPSLSEIKSLENNLSAISQLKSEGCCLEGIQIKDPAAYYRQYIGIIVNGKKVIYINAFFPTMGESKKNKNYWRKHAINICDGVESAWGCVYDITDGKFESLSINVVG